MNNYFNCLYITPVSASFNFNKLTSNTKKYKRIKPEEGKMVFFPGYLLHMVEENKSGETRISLSTNTQV